MNETAENRNASMFQLSTLGPAAIQSLVKLDPRHVARNPVMFVVEVSACLLYTSRCV